MKNNNPDLVTVLETSDTFALALGRSALDDAGINYLVIGDDPRYFSGYPGAFGASGVGQTPLAKGVCGIQVARGSEAEARALLEPLQNPPAEAEYDPEPEQNS